MFGITDSRLNRTDSFPKNVLWKRQKPVKYENELEF